MEITEKEAKWFDNIAKELKERIPHVTESSWDYSRTWGSVVFDISVPTKFYDGKEEIDLHHSQWVSLKEIRKLSYPDYLIDRLVTVFTQSEHSS